MIRRLPTPRVAPLLRACLRTRVARSLGWAAGIWLLGARPAAAQQAPEVSPDEPSGPTRSECAQAFEESQRLRNAARYLEANQQALRCANPSCGAALSEECSKIYNELEAATPSVVFAARDAAGNELANVSVRIDDGATEHVLDGKPVALDPGNHTFTFRGEPFAEQVQAAVIRTGERFRSITVVLEPRNGKASGTASVSSDLEPTRADEAPHRVPVGVFVLGGVAAIGIGGFVGFRLSGANDFDQLSSSCKPDCRESEVDAVRQKYLFSSISLAVAGAATVAGVSWYFLSRPDRPNTAARLELRPSSGGMTARVSAPF